MSTFELEINGYTITTDVTLYHHQPPLGPTADNDVDARGYTDIEWEITNIETFDEDGDEIKLTIMEELGIIEDYSDIIECKLLKIMKDLREEREEKS